MSLMKKKVLIVLSLFSVGCYDFEDGSEATVLSAMENGEEGRDKHGAWNECDPGADWWNDMQSGDECSGFNGCGTVDPDSAEDMPYAREAHCINDVLSVTEAKTIEENEPRDVTLWKDCSALDDGRTGEACEGVFSCYAEASSGCIEKVACGDSSASGTSDLLVRYLLCDDANDTSSSPSDAVYTDCESAKDARALDTCKGSFLCEKATETGENTAISACDGGEGYCREGEETAPTWNLVWCDSGTIRVLSDMDGAIPFLLGKEEEVFFDVEAAE